jgi:transcriptional repressor NrdR
MPMTVLKSDNRREPFTREKLREGIARACKKRDISAEQIDQLVTEAETELQEQYVMEAPSSAIGDLVLKKLKQLDPVAYVRFASVYKQFSNIDSFLDELKELKQEKTAHSKNGSAANGASSNGKAKSHDA